MADAFAAAESPPYLSVAQVARRLGCSVSLVQKWRRLGWIKATRLGTPDVGVYGYLPEEVDRFARETWNRRRGRPPRPSDAGGRCAPPMATATRPLALWDADPRTDRAIILARFQPSELSYALSVATAWAHRYDTLVLGEASSAAGPESIIALWRNGRRIDTSQSNTP